MPKESVIKHYSSSTTGSAPSAVDLIEGELAINTADEKVFFKNLGGTVVDLASSKAISGAYAAKALPNTFTATQTFNAGLSSTTATIVGDMAVDTNTLYVDSANNRVGIGTTSGFPTTQEKVMVFGTGVNGIGVRGSIPFYRWYNENNQELAIFFTTGAAGGTGGDFVLQNSTTGSIAFKRAGGRVNLYIRGTDGNVAIGDFLSSASLPSLGRPGDALTVSGNASVSGSLTASTMFASNIVNSFNSLTGAVSYSPAIASASVTGVASFNSAFFSVSTGAVSLNSTYAGAVTSLNGLTGARTLTGDGGAIFGTANTTIAARLATASLTGVASFPATDFAVSAAGAVTLTGNVAKTNVAQTFTALKTFSVGISGIGATFSGHLSAATKSFVIPHPTVSGMKLHHGSLEGPENGVYVRGNAHGRTVDLPHYWTGLVDESTITVQVTPFGRSQNLYVESVSIHQVVIGGDENPSYFYTVYGERKDVPKLKVEV